ncbi:SDR family oxidoreductase [Pseudooceanicola sp. CBS1P-1]|uniref:Glucose 1-dehydrogenase n=1 Tax=Pseudooceanicola albus TaxID=2692189 RepID=A0A6L7G6U4_9RHOB|nr:MULTISPECIES: SDR family NAD(P)-dependent oxidoreductase [Pseudooceanicola]MBT9385920.1 SDR family oxidoreductase [Pseudooceanicola endophyticus]MXN19659.1 glucose 1-dehydrogenase [Pseudooceanicola albus]
MSPHSLPASIFPDLSGQRALVTGAASGIGRAIATALAAQGVRVALADLNPEAAQAVADSLPGDAFALPVDVRQRASVEAAVKAALDTMGGLDILIANAGVSSMARALEITDAEWDFNMDVNTRGVFLANQIAGQIFAAQGHGTIVNTASLAAKVGAPLLAHYSASKFAVVGWTQALAREMAPLSIRVNAVCPGFVRTSMQEREIGWEATLRGMTPEAVEADYIAQTPLGRIETPEDVAGVVVFLCSESARFMTGQAINVTGGVYMT